MNKERLVQKMRVMVEVCKGFASLSHDPKHKVGAVVFNRNFGHIPGIGYNGNYSGGPNERDSMEPGKSGYIHAEVNAMYKMDLPNYIIGEHAMVVTLSPCDMCAKGIVQNGIKRVFILTQHSELQNYPTIFKNAGVKYYVMGTDADYWDAKEIAKVLDIKLDGEDNIFKRYWQGVRKSLQNFWPFS